jgi:hypothetical protein
MGKWLGRFCLLASASLVLGLGGCDLFTESGDEGDNSAIVDIDGDDIPNIDDMDMDNDGIPNVQDDDIDGDGVPNISDSDIDGDGNANIDDNDIDGDGVPNNKDGDIDGDGTVNSADDDIDGDGIANGNDIDIDGDGIVNSQDTDMDGDGIPNTADSVPDGTGDGSSGTQGTSNTGADQNSGENDDTVTSSGLAVEASDDFTVEFTITNTAAGSSNIQVELVELQDIRDEVDNNNIDLASAYVKNLSVSVAPGSQSFVTANASARCVVKIYYQQVGDESTRTLIAQTPEPGGVFDVVTFGVLNSSVSLNAGLYVAMPGYAEYMNIIKDETQTEVEVVTEVQLIDALTQPGTVELEIETTLAGKKKT